MKIKNSNSKEAYYTDLKAGSVFKFGDKFFLKTNFVDSRGLIMAANISDGMVRGFDFETVEDYTNTAFLNV